MPDAVFLDLGMPGFHHTVLAALTGWGQHEDRARTSKAGFSHHLVKPPEPAALERVLAATSGRKNV